MIPEWEQKYLLCAAENLLMLKLMRDGGVDIRDLDYKEDVTWDYVNQTNYLEYLSRLFRQLEPVDPEALEAEETETSENVFLRLPAYAAVARAWGRLPADIAAELEELAQGPRALVVPVVETLFSDIWGCGIEPSAPRFDVWPTLGCVVLRDVWAEGDGFTAQDMAWAIALKKALDRALHAATALSAEGRD